MNLVGFIFVCTWFVLFLFVVDWFCFGLHLVGLFSCFYMLVGFGSVFAWLVLFFKQIWAKRNIIRSGGYDYELGCWFDRSLTILIPPMAADVVISNRQEAYSQNLKNIKKWICPIVFAGVVFEVSSGTDHDHDTINGVP